MSCGIYLLRFSGTMYVYIGQSENIENRFKEHINNLKLNRASQKLQAAFTLFGMPTLEILEFCSVDMLNELELSYIEKYDSCNHGLNSTNSTTYKNLFISSLPHRCKYTELDYYNVLLECINNPATKSRTIAELTNTDTSTVSALRNLKSYKWLKTRYPEEYGKLEEIYTNKLKEPTTTTEQILVEKEIKKYPTIVSPDGIIYSIPFGQVRTFAKQHRLNYTGLNKVLNKKLEHISGWRLE